MASLICGHDMSAWAALLALLDEVRKCFIDKHLNLSPFALGQPANSRQQLDTSAYRPNERCVA